MQAAKGNKVLVSRDLERYSRALREAAGLAQLYGSDMYVWQTGQAHNATYSVAGQGIKAGDTLLVKVSKV